MERERLLLAAVHPPCPTANNATSSPECVAALTGTLDACGKQMSVRSERAPPDGPGHRHNRGVHGRPVSSSANVSLADHLARALVGVPIQLEAGA
jgi:hypothetical protein